MKRVAPILAVAALACGFLSSSASADVTDFGIETFDASITSSQAGAHPDMSTEFELKRDVGGGSFATARDITIELPPGLLGNPNAVESCTALQLTTTVPSNPSNENSCPQDAQVGISEVTLYEGGVGPTRFVEPVYNMEPPNDEDVVARLGLFAYLFPVFINIEVRSESDYGLTAEIEGIGSVIPLLGADTTIWGVPADESHDGQRITPHEALLSGAPDTPNGKRKSGLAPAPFLSNPTTCGAPQEVRITATSYALPDQPDSKSDALPAINGCGKVGFEPKLSVTPTSQEAASPTGLEATLTVPQDESVKGLATSQLKDAVVTLPQGMTIAPGAADGLEACTPAQAAYKQPGPSRCPAAAKIGSAEIDVPALSRELQGSVYQRSPEPGRLFQIWLVVDDLGVHVKLPGSIEVDKANGQITSLFLDTPQVPVREFKLHFKSGARAPLANPACGTYLTQYSLAPWSGAPAVESTTPMTVNQDCGNTSGFTPELQAGSTNPLAGAFSTFLTRLIREGGENVAGLEVSPPPGLLAKLAGVPLCADAQSGNCPADSRIGKVTVATGPGPSPLWIPQPGKTPTAVYLSGPYKGAPYSLLAKVPAQAGPFDLGTVITRVALQVDPRTARVTAKSDPLPQILEGVPVTYRTIDVAVDRPNFALNPTDCDPMTVDGTATSDKGTVANLSDRFQLGGCAALGFKPKLAMRLFGATNRGAHPRLRAVLRARKGDANIERAVVALPRSEFLDQSHIRTVCTRVQFAAKQCPAASIYGKAKAFTPLLDQPLSGPVYLRSSENLLPDLVVALRGQVDVDLTGRIDTVNSGIRATFENVPDAPVSKFVIEMQGGKKGLLINSRNLCKASYFADAELDAQNGKTADQRPAMNNRCGKSRKQKKK
jgi:hypothetical protein